MPQVVASYHGITLPSVVFALAISVATLLAALIYRRVWIALRGASIVPTGFGLLTAPAMLGGAFIAGGANRLFDALAVIGVATLLYWLDDVVELSARLRLAIAFVSGLLAGGLCLAGPDGYAGLAFAALVLGAGLACVVLTQIVNFYDGADLNLATFIGLTSAFILLFAPVRPEWAAIALALLGFLLPFGALNSRPRTIYLGDSGSFAFAGLLTVMASAFVRDFASLPPEAAIPVALPAFDVFFVFLIRLRENHDLLTRNYLHLYQRLNRHQPGFRYLIPQLVNAAFIVAGAALLQAAGFGRILSVIVAMPLVTIPVYFGFRQLLLAGRLDAPRPLA